MIGKYDAGSRVVRGFWGMDKKCSYFAAKEKLG